MTIYIDPLITPNFTQVANGCSGSTILPLPTTSLNNISGTWSPAINNSSTTTYTFTPSAGQCASNQTMTIYIDPSIVPIFSINNEICKGHPTVALPNISNNGILGSWSPPAIITNLEGVYNYTFTPDNQTCSIQKEINIKVIYCELQKGISPLGTSTGDGLNDYFKTTCKKFEIFNRYGMLVYTKENYENEWYGQSDNGSELPDGTYYYVINTLYDEIKTGWVYINREK